ncbi:ABC transporter substrate-binding protein [Lysobacter concretionis Ko07 = DSM 16239]|jgi:phospholipid/cholesterol/gamma-HCH transport system substrate-binding protein|uniref:ABC transporter substrate-binding protein n=1 Tax=Lysobacter concretionis Ko07 = DSM 16239 TaxID=1122185 RepID=A0A0A0EUY7_9GAMM|nr:MULTISPECIES: MlaD family protein [Lysobacter]KGM52957.1 ABC transporter substrate-binding protein [Lysobacter concretionis Ko07 = DSM 16239]QOD91395.1 MCE family protein [Lysobacter sp. CW239]
METKANYVLIGAFTILVTLFLLMFALWAAKYSSDKSWQHYRVVFNEPVTGMSEGSSVQYNGISVGSVERLSLAPNDPRRVIALLKVQASAPVKTDTRAKMSMTSITGSPIIQLTGGEPASPRLVDVDKREVPIIQTEPSALQNIADTANRLVARMDELLSEQNVRRVSETLENIETLTGAVAGQHDDLRALIVNARKSSEQLEATLTTANHAMEGFDRELVDKLPGLIARLDSTLVRLDSAAAGADGILNENRAAINSFANDGLSQLGPTLGELRALVRDLRRMSDRLDNNPTRYLLGRDAPKEFEPE